MSKEAQNKYFFKNFISKLLTRSLTSRRQVFWVEGREWGVRGVTWVDEWCVSMLIWSWRCNMFIGVCSHGHYALKQILKMKSYNSVTVMKTFLYYLFDSKFYILYDDLMWTCPVKVPIKVLTLFQELFLKTKEQRNFLEHNEQKIGLFFELAFEVLIALLFWS